MSNSAKVDQKGRLKIPVTLLPMLRRSGTELYVTSEDGYSVRIYPMQVWNQVEERLERLCSRNRNNQKLLVRAKYFGQAVTMDKQGRVLIPIVLRSSAQMKGAVDIFDYLNYLEVWNHVQFLKDLKSSPITAQDEKTLNKLSSAPRFPWAIRRNKEAIQDTPPSASGFTRSSEPRDSRYSNRSGRARAWRDLARSQMKMH